MEKGDLQAEVKRVKSFAKKISNKLTSSDYRGLYSKKGVVKLLTGYGYPISEGVVDDGNWEEIYNILTEI